MPTFRARVAHVGLNSQAGIVLCVRVCPASCPRTPVPDVRAFVLFPLKQSRMQAVALLFVRIQQLEQCRIPHTQITAAVCPHVRGTPSKAAKPLPLFAVDGNLEADSQGTAHNVAAESRLRAGRRRCPLNADIEQGAQGIFDIQGVGAESFDLRVLLAPAKAVP